jgi:hypothetical protein
MSSSTVVPDEESPNSPITSIPMSSAFPDNEPEFRRQYPDAVPQSELDAFRDEWQREVANDKSPPPPPIYIPVVPENWMDYYDTAEFVKFYTEGRGRRAQREFPLTARDLLVFSEEMCERPPEVPGHDLRLDCCICLELKSHPVAYVILYVFRAF